jgi:hypothetical protein
MGTVMAENVHELLKRFQRMAERMSVNGNESFGGAFVIIPPEDGGEPIETLILDSKQDASQFWMLLKTKCDIALGELDQKQRQAATFGRQR